MLRKFNVLILVIICSNLNSFSNEVKSDSSIFVDYFIEGVMNLELFQDYEQALLSLDKAINLFEYNSKLNYNNNFISQEFESLYVSKAYQSRAICHEYFENYKNSIEDINLAIFYYNKLYLPVSSHYFQRAQIYSRLDDFQLAADDYSSGLIIDYDIMSLYKRGVCYYFLGFYDEAISDLSIAIDSISDSRLLQARGNCFLKTSKYLSAVNDFSSSLKIKNDAEVFYSRAIAFAFLRSYENSCKDFKRACSLGYEFACNQILDKNGVCFIDNTSVFEKVNNKNNLQNKFVLPIFSEGDMKFIFISFSGKKYKYLIDSGASDIIINSEIENHLINNGQLLPENYVGQKSYEIANGDIITLKFANLPYIELNNNKFYNIDIAIGDNNSSLLMGMSFLNRFDWKINQDNLILNVK